MRQKVVIKMFENGENGEEKPKILPLTEVFIIYEKFLVSRSQKN